jgi:hypothetical protein
MKKKILLTLTALLVLSMGIIYAATPSALIEDLTGLSYDELYTLHASGMTYGEIAEQYDVFDAFHEGMLADKKIILDQWVADGTITAAEEEAILKQFEQCDPNNPNYIMRSYGGGQGNGFGNGGGPGQGCGFNSFGSQSSRNGFGQGNTSGLGRGYGRGMMGNGFNQ